ncbi:MAG: ankyrin repeat domain-containing protein, partial [Comamonadaceae bacterium]
LKDRTGNTPLQLARSRGYAAMVKLLEAGKAR